MYSILLITLYWLESNGPPKNYYSLDFDTNYFCNLPLINDVVDLEYLINQFFFTFFTFFTFLLSFLVLCVCMLAYVDMFKRKNESEYVRIWKYTIACIYAHYFVHLMWDKSVYKVVLCIIIFKLKVAI